MRSLSGEAMRIAGVKRRAILVGDGPGVTHLHHAVGSNRSGIPYEFVGAVTDGDGDADLPRARLRWRASRPCSRTRTVDELILTDGAFERPPAARASSSRRTGAASRFAWRRRRPRC